MYILKIILETKSKACIKTILNVTVVSQPRCSTHLDWAAGVEGSG